MVNKIISSQVNFEILSHEGNSVTVGRILAGEKVKRVQSEKGRDISKKVVIECFSTARLIQLKKAQLLNLKKQKKKLSMLERIIERIRITEAKY